MSMLEKVQGSTPSAVYNVISIASACILEGRMFNDWAVSPVCICDFSDRLLVEIKWAGVLQARIYYMLGVQFWETVYEEPIRGNVMLMGKNGALGGREFHLPSPTPLV